ncbi:DUF3616 domain-containing protein [Azospirillum sp. HJ39]|uniref:DUF3616 domain-containing protein n=1 Tax=Azospirillum sp. HJ39 TaxID=3159496 RepID=UPI0035579878
MKRVDPTGDVIRNLSALEVDGDCLWFAADEDAAIHRVVRKGRHRYAKASSYRLWDYFPQLPEGPDREVDIEGLSIFGDALWVLGSHCRARAKDGVQDGAPGPIEARPNRHLLARLALGNADADGRRGLADPGEPGAASSLAFTAAGDALTDALADDPLFSPFLALPAKENGLDLEGLAVDGTKVYVGLRGPVVAGKAILLELTIGFGAEGGLELVDDGSGCSFRKHILDLDGLGIRDLVLRGKDLFILAGPTMLLDGPCFIYRWRRERTGSIKEVERILQVPTRWKSDHPEGLTLIAVDGEERLLVVYDSPAKQRIDGSKVAADLFETGSEGNS